MKRGFLLLCALACALPVCAQNENTQTKELGFNFAFNYSAQQRVTEVTIGYQREFDNSKPVPFDESVMGKSGVIERETLTFQNRKGDVLGTLTTLVDLQTGKLKSQTLAQKGKPARALSWFKTKTQSPPLSVVGSLLNARYTLKNGKLSARGLALQLPLGARTLDSQYDGLGRRTVDASTGNEGPTSFRFFYDAQGLTRFTSSATKDEPPKEVTLVRAQSGAVTEATVKESGVLIARMLPRFDSDGGEPGMRMENYQNGVLAGVMVLDPKNKTAKQEEYENGKLKSRRAFQMEGQLQLLLTLEEFEDNRLTRRTHYNPTGAVTKIETFKEDGTVEETRNFKDGVQVEAPK